MGKLRSISRYALKIALCLAILTPCARAADTVIFAAASLKTALDAVVAVYETDTAPAISYAGTSVLARQISQGAPADIIISANQDWMDWLAAQNAIDPDSRFNLLGNQLVLIQHGPQGAPPNTAASALPHLIQNERIAMALVDAVPAGIYGKSALQTLGLWTQLEPQVIQTDNARAALALVARGEARFGIVYATDALAEPQVSVAFTFPPDSHDEILYPVAIVAGHTSDRVTRLLDHLRSPLAQDLFATHGFTPIAPPP